jgi:putative hydrolase of the HAD superfamily
LFTDLGGVLLTNGWDRACRQRAAERFGLDPEDTDERHHLTFDTYEVGRLSLDEYLHRVVFNVPRPFSPEDFAQFMFSQSQPLQDMIDMVKRLKAKYDLEVYAISNEGAELAQYRIDSFDLPAFIDGFFVSGFLNTRKPDVSIFKTAFQATQAKVESAVYMDDRLLFVEVASSLGLHAVHHQNIDLTRSKLAALGLQDEG